MAEPRVVLRPISGLDAQPGDVVDVAAWRNAAKLERARYLGRPDIHSDDHGEPDSAEDG